MARSTIAAALAARDRHPDRDPSGRPARVIYDSVDIVTESNARHRDAVPRPPADRAAAEAGWAAAADQIVTINEAFAERLTEMWHPARPIAVVPNVPEPPDPAVLANGPNLLREAAGLRPGRASSSSRAGPARTWAWRRPPRRSPRSRTRRS